MPLSSEDMKIFAPGHEDHPRLYIDTCTGFTYDLLGDCDDWCDEHGMKFIDYAAAVDDPVLMMYCIAELHEHVSTDTIQIAKMNDSKKCFEHIPSLTLDEAIK